MLKLRYNARHRSITDLSDVPDLAPFSLITGPNGSGKSHLLEAIQNGNVVCSIEDVEVAVSEIRSFNWQTLHAGQSSPADSSARLNMVAQLWPQVKIVRDRHADSLRNICAAAGLDVRLHSNEDLLKKCLSDDLVVENPQIVSELATIQNEINAQLQQYAQTGRAWENRIDSDLLRTDGSVNFAAMSESEFRRKVYKPTSALDPFKQELSAIFALYRKLQRENYANRSDPHPPEPPIGDDEFKAEYGEPPWELLNRMLTEGGYRFQFSTPEDVDGPFSAQIQSTSNGETWTFDDLSSGERVLVAFVIASYSIENRQLKKTLPKLILLDEIDAPLHPTMISSIMSTIGDTLVKEQGVHCLVTTHNPATLVIAADASVYQMSPESPRLCSITPEDGIRALSAGLPTLNVSIDSRRAVWVESNTDVGLYESLFLRVRSLVDGPFVPVFQSVGFTPAAQVAGAGSAALPSEQSGGKDRVKEVVKRLLESGVQNVRGLVDGDNGTDPSQAEIVVFSGGQRYAIENVLLDPLLIGLLIIRERMACAVSRSTLALSDTGTWGGIDFSNSLELQRIIDAVIAVVGPPLTGSTDTALLRVLLVGGQVVELPKWFLEERGHNWFDRLLAAFPCLNSRGRSETALMSSVVRIVLADEPQLLAQDALESLSQLCK